MMTSAQQSYDDDDILMVAALKEEYARYCAKVAYPLPYLEWKYREERRAEAQGVFLT